MTKTADYANALIDAKNLIKWHCQVDYNNSYQIQLAEIWFNDILKAMCTGQAIPAKPTQLRNLPQ